MTDEYPAQWTPPWINHEEPVKVNGRAISSLRSGCPNPNAGEPEPHAYPSTWLPR
jgi:hypothetical protein